MALGHVSRAVFFYLLVGCIFKSVDTWTIRRLLQWSASWLTERGCGSARLDAELLLAEVLELDRITLYMDPDRPLTQTELAAFKVVLKRRARREPVAYILGHRDFWKHTFVVASGVLIPRPESEGLLEAIIERYPQRDVSLNILEIGVGSGAVLCSLLEEYPKALGVGTDISNVALAITRQNGEEIAVSERLRLLPGDLVTPLAMDDCFDVILSNPPYIKHAELATLAPEVAEWEPREALDGGEDGLAILRRLVVDCGSFLKPGGLLVLEIAHDQNEEVSALLVEADYEEVVVRKDYGGHPRIVTGVRKVDE